MASIRDQICIINDKIIETDRELDDIRATLQSLKQIRLELSKQVFNGKTAQDVIEEYFVKLHKISGHIGFPRIAVNLFTGCQRWLLVLDTRYSDQVEPCQDVLDAYTIMGLEQPNVFIEEQEEY